MKGILSLIQGEGPATRTPYGLALAFFVFFVFSLINFVDKRRPFHHDFKPTPVVELPVTIQSPWTVENNNLSTKLYHQKPFLQEDYEVFLQQCLTIDESSFRAIADLTSLQPLRGIVYHFQQGNFGTETKGELTSGSEFCSLILVPQESPSHKNPQDDFQDQIDKGWGPDSIRAEIVSADVRLVFNYQPIHRMTLSSPNVTYEVYAVAYALNHPGEYHFKGEVEYKNFDWTMDEHLNLRTDKLAHTVLEEPLLSGSPSIRVTGMPVSRPERQCFDNSTKQSSGFHGRWYRASSFHPKTGNQTALNQAAGLDFAAHNNTVDEHGWTFAPDACSLTYFTREDHLSCFEKRTIQVLGDSNGRRALKSLIGGGVGWCAYNTIQASSNSACKCEDAPESSIRDANYTKVNMATFEKLSDRVTPTHFGRNSTAFMDFVGGLMNHRLGNPWQKFFSLDITKANSSVTAKRISNVGSLDVVYISTLTWDIGLLHDPFELLTVLPFFRNTIYAAYPPSTRFVFRLPNALCCGSQNRNKRYSPPRFVQFNSAFREFWSEDEAQGRVAFLDASVLQGRPEMETGTKAGCEKATTHLKGSLVNLESMMLMNAVCEGGNGTASMKTWSAAP